MINFDYKSHAIDMMKSTALQLCAGVLLSKVYFPVVVKEGAVLGALLRATTNLTQTVTFHTTPLEENLRNKTIIGLATIALMYFATTRLIAGPLLRRVSLELSADKVLKLCLSSFATYVGYTIWQEKSRAEPQNPIQTNDLKSALYGLKDVTAKDTTGRTALHKAARENNQKAIKTLLKAGAKVDEKDNKCGHTPLHHAATLGQVEAVKALLEGGAKVDEKAIAGHAPLHYAAELGQVEAVKALLEGGAKVDEKDNDGHTPLHYAAEKGHEEVVKILREATPNSDWLNWMSFVGA